MSVIFTQRGLSLFLNYDDDGSEMGGAGTGQ